MSTTARKRRPVTNPRSSNRRRGSKSARLPLWVAIIGAVATIAGATIGGILASSNPNPVQTTVPTPVQTAVPTPVASPKSTGSASTPLIAGDNSMFIRDVTYPDRSKVAVGQHFIKKWEIKNIGTVPWVGRYLAALGPSTGSCTYPARVPVPATKPGQSVIISVPVTAASTPQLCYVIWKMVTSNGILYFPGLIGMWFEINVINTPTRTA
jgi:hypothetical protein